MTTNFSRETKTEAIVLGALTHRLDTLNKGVATSDDTRTEHEDLNTLIASYAEHDPNPAHLVRDLVASAADAVEMALSFERSEGEDRGDVVGRYERFCALFSRRLIQLFAHDVMNDWEG